MKPLDQISSEELNQVKIVTFDIDGVVIKTGTRIEENEDGTELSVKTNQLSPNFVENLKKLKKYVRLNFSSGRNLLYLRSLVNEIFDETIILQAENGNMTWLDGKITNQDYQSDYFNKLRDIKTAIVKLRSTDVRIRGFEPKMLLITVHCDEMEEIPALVRGIDKDNELYCDWTLEGYDIGKRGVNKGTAIKDLSERLNIPAKQILTTGNNVNDIEMLKTGLGVSVRPDRVEGEYFIDPKEGELGGETLAEFLLGYFKD